MAKPSKTEIVDDGGSIAQRLDEPILPGHRRVVTLTHVSESQLGDYAVSAGALAELVLTSIRPTLVKAITAERKRIHESH